MELLTARELCQTLKISKTTLYRLVQKGMPSVGSGRRRRFELDTVLRWMNGGHPHADDASFMRAGMYRCERCYEVLTFKGLIPFDKFYCTQCFRRTLEWVGTPWEQPGGKSTN